MLIGESDESMRCPKCKKIAVKLVTVTGYKKHKKVCRRCKKKVKSLKYIKVFNQDGGRIMANEEKKVTKKDTKVNKVKKVVKKAAMKIGMLSDKTCWIALSENRLKQLGFNLDNTTPEVRESVFKKIGIK